MIQFNLTQLNHCTRPKNSLLPGFAHFHFDNISPITYMLSLPLNILAPLYQLHDIIKEECFYCVITSLILGLFCLKDVATLLNGMAPCLSHWTGMVIPGCSASIPSLMIPNDDVALYGWWIRKTLTGLAMVRIHWNTAGFALKRYRKGAMSVTLVLKAEWYTVVMICCINPCCTLSCQSWCLSWYHRVLWELFLYVPSS